MKFFKQRQVDPRAKKLADDTMSRLELLGVTIPQKRARCLNDMFQRTLKFVKAIQKGGEADPEAESFSFDMKSILTKYGVAEDKQDEILTWYVNTMMSEVS